MRACGTSWQGMPLCIPTTLDDLLSARFMVIFGLRQHSDKSYESACAVESPGNLETVIVSLPRTSLTSCLEFEDSANGNGKLASGCLPMKAMTAVKYDRTAKRNASEVLLALLLSLSGLDSTSTAALDSKSCRLLFLTKSKFPNMSSDSGCCTVCQNCWKF